MVELIEIYPEFTEAFEELNNLNYTIGEEDVEHAGGLVTAIISLPLVTGELRFYLDQNLIKSVLGEKYRYYSHFGAYNSFKNHLEIIKHEKDYNSGPVRFFTKALCLSRINRLDREFIENNINDYNFDQFKFIIIEFLNECCEFFESMI